MRRFWGRVAVIGIVATTTGVAAVSTPAAQAERPARMAAPVLSRFTEPLPVPPVIDLTGGGAVALDMVGGSHRFHSRLPLTPTFGYVPAGSTPPPGGAYLGPTIEAKRGRPVALTVTNKLDAHPLASYVDTSLEGVDALDRTAPRAAVHLHGGHVAPDSDGGPVETFRPAGVDPGDFAGGSGSVTYQYPNDQEATQLWYHDHALGITRLNVVAGLAGNYLVRDDFDTGRPGNSLGLPTGAREIPLVLQDRSFNADGTFSYPLGPFVNDTRPDYPNQWAPEFFGDVATVNGRAWPNLDVDRAVYRFRVLNGSNSRVYRLAVRAASPASPASVPVWQIGAEGGLFDTPVRLRSLVIAPGERADLLLDFRRAPRGQRIVVTNDAPTPYPDGPRTRGAGGVPLTQVMQFTGTGRAVEGVSGIPQSLRGGPGQPAPLPPVEPTASRTVLLNEIIDPATGAPTEALINNLGFHEHHDGVLQIPRETSIETPRLNTVEEWVIVNTTMDAHPIHLHLTQFRVVNRQRIDVAAFLATYNPALPVPSASDSGPWPVPAAGPYLIGSPTPPAPNEAGWKDTVVALPGTVTRIVVPFGGTAAGLPAPFTGDSVGATQRFVGDYVFHCHILEHEDNDMMQPYRVVAS